MSDKQSKKTPTGFTLVELSIVIVLMLLIGFAAAPNVMFVLEKASLNAILKQLKSDIDTTRNWAFQSQYLKKIVFIPSESTYKIYRQDQDEQTDQWILDEETRVFKNRFKILSTTLPNQQIIFSGHGIPYEDPQGDLPSLSLDNKTVASRNIIISNGEIQKKIIIFPQTGFTRIFD